MDIRAIFIDLDGTLLTRKNEISQRNVTAITMLLNQGVKVFLATGRQYEITAPYHKKLGLKTPMICLNGASIHDAHTGKAIQTKSVNIDEERFYRLTQGNQYNVIVHTTTGTYCKRTSPEIEEWTREAGSSPTYNEDLHLVNYGKVLKYSVRTGFESAPIAMEFMDEADVIHWDDGFEIVAQGVSKWAAIQTIIKAYGIGKDNVVTIGDGPNDITMLSHSGFGVAMENASSEVKAAANYITLHHENDGLADFIERYLINTYSI
ncbi:HAD family hydrolase [Evansella sp. AB-rgal1]|uniref:HAD family hydrolase n=1 Tax=Evansella sp. AB-rgal1 TaxID=3242696 RepID=UPI00359ED841